MSALPEDLPKVGPKTLKFYDSYFSYIQQGDDAQHEVMPVLIQSDGSKGIEVGTTAEKRVGQRVFLKKLCVAIKAFYNTGLNSNYYIPGTPNGQTCRILIVMDTQTNGATMSATDLLDQSDTGSTSVANVPSIQHYHMAASKRFRVLYDKVVQINADAPGFQSTTNAISTKYHHIKIELPLKDTIIYADENENGTINGIRSNNLYLITTTDKQDPLNGYEPYVSWRVNSRVFFTD
jgi:hypothetical protein